MLCGYPDIYDYDYDSHGGAGKFCLMGKGGHGTNPSQICAYLKLASGWGTVTDLDLYSSTTATVTAFPEPNYNHWYRYLKPGVSTEYFLVENRQSTERDDGLPASGVAVWHVDERGDRDNQSLEPNTVHANYELTLVQADNAWHFQNNSNTGDSRDLYYAGNSAASYDNTLTDFSSPHANWWDGTESGVHFSDFSVSGPSMTFQVAPARQVQVVPGTGLKFAKNEGESIQPASGWYTLTNAAGVSVEWTVSHAAAWLSAVPPGGTLPAFGTADVAIAPTPEAEALGPGLYAETLTFSNSLDAEAVTERTVSLLVWGRDYFTEYFDDSWFDLAYQSLTFEPDGSGSFYTVTREPASVFPCDTSAATALDLGDDDYVQVELSGGILVWLYGTSYSTFFVGSNGSVTFGSGDTDYTESLADHFGRPRISGLFDDLNPAAGGTVYAEKLADRTVVTYLNVPEYGTSTANSFQIEMFIDGVIRITYLGIAATDGLVGLSEGLARVS